MYVHTGTVRVRAATRPSDDVAETRGTNEEQASFRFDQPPPSFDFAMPEDLLVDELRSNAESSDSTTTSLKTPVSPLCWADPDVVGGNTRTCCNPYGSRAW